LPGKKIKRNVFDGIFHKPGESLREKEMWGTFATGFCDLQNMLKPIWHRRQRIENKKA
jgi:hypothetical protein